MTRHFARTILLSTAAAIAVATPAAAQSLDAVQQFDIASQPIADALLAFSKKSRIQIVTASADLGSTRAPAIKGRLAPREALTQMLAGTGLVWREVGQGSVVVASASAAGNEPAGTQASVPAQGSTGAESEDTAQGGDLRSDGAIAEILVQGRRTQNVDIRRTEDDPQPYVVFDREEIERSQATSLEDFFRTRLPMNTASASGAQDASISANAGNSSSINLRGFGRNQTLILIDGRRAPRVLNNGVDFLQADINGIPLSAIERIEVLPSTAGGIYGGGAVGGVINIIRKRDYKGLDLQASYTGTTRGGGETFRIDLSGGFSLEGGKTQVSFNASHQASEPLYVEDRSFWRRRLARLTTNDPNFFNTPTLGYTTNIRSVSGAPLVLDDGRALGSAITHVPLGYAGPGSDGGAALLAGAGTYNLELAENAAGGRRTLLANPRVRSANLNLRRSFGSAIDGFVDLTISDNLGRSLFITSLNTTLAADAPANPFQQAVNVNVPLPGLDRPARSRSQTLAGTGGIIARLGQGWTATAEYGWSRSRNKTSYTRNAYNTATINNALASGALDIFRDLNAYSPDLTPYHGPSPDSFEGPYDTVQRTASGRLSGRLLDLSGGALSLTALVEHRHEKANLNYTRVPLRTYIYPARSQSVDSGYVELRAPLISAQNAIPFVHEFELQASVRHDRYRSRTASQGQISFPSGADILLPDWNYDTSRLSSTDYSLALHWAPVQDISFRASYGTGFLPPSIDQLTPRKFSLSSALWPDPLRGNRYVGEEVPVLSITGGNPDLEPEESKSLSLGAILTPRLLPGLRLSIDYSRIRKGNEITLPQGSAILARPDLYPGRIERGPNLPGDPVGWPGPVIRLDGSYINLASSRLQAVDFQVDYELETTRLGHLRFYGVATWTDEYWQRPFPTDPGFDNVGHYIGPLKWRGNAGVNWRLGAWELSWNAQYYHSYSVRYGDPAYQSLSDRNVIQHGAERIPSQIYHDLAVQYRFGSSAGGRASLLSDVELRLGIQNVFDKYPPVFARVDDPAGYSTFGDPRMRRFTLTIRKSFGS